MSKKIGLAVLLVAFSGAALADDTCKSPTANNPACTDLRAAPEMDSGSAMAGLALALGGLTVLRGRRSN